MNERERRKYELGKAEILVGKLIYQLYLFLAVASVTALAGSVAAYVFDVLPAWADITMGAFGALNLPGSINALGKMDTWIQNADRVVVNMKK